jgi:hypothetical protein
MEWMQWLIPLLSALLSGSGIWALFSARTTAKATQAAALAAAAPAAQQATTADWNSLMSFWQSEMAALRANAAQMEVRLLFLEEQREEDIRYIEDLEQHIWKSLPPPPPVRKRRFKPEAP